MPILPFPVEDVLLPGMTKDLHLYEPRYLELLQHVMQSGEKEFAIVVIEDANSSSAYTPGSFCSDGVGFCYPVISKVWLVQQCIQFRNFHKHVLDTLI